MQIDQVKKDIKEMLNSQRLGVLATYGSKYPYATIVGFAATDDLSHILFATLRDTRKYRNMKVDPHVSILIDNRSNRVDDFSNAQALTILGIGTEILEGEEHELISLYINRHPYLREFASDPNCAIMKVKVDKYILVSRFQEVMEWDMR
jgi:heme iron utilization protein